MIVEEVLNIPADYQDKAYNSKNIFQRNWHRNKFAALDWYFNFLKGNNKRRVLDIGTGSGNFEIIFHNKFSEIFGVDYNTKALDYLESKIAEKNIKNVNLKFFDATNFDENDLPAGIDIVVIIDVIEHIDKKHGIKLLKVLHKKLSDDGKIIVMTPNYSSLWLFIEKLLDKFTLVPKFDGAQHIARYDVDTLSKLFDECDFETVLSTSINTLSFLFPHDKVSRFLNVLEINSKFKHGNLVFSVFQKKSE